MKVRLEDGRTAEIYKYYRGEFPYWEGSIIEKSKYRKGRNDHHLATWDYEGMGQVFALPCSKKPPDIDWERE